MKTIIITEKQKKKLKKAIAAQDQVGGKVNAGVMDAVVGGMCEDAKDDHYMIGAEMNSPIGGVYHHVVEENLNESPDQFASKAFNAKDSYPFVKLKYNNKFYVGEERQTHYNLVKSLFESGEINDKVFEKDFLDNYTLKPYDYFFDDTMTGRYWGEYNVISFWKTPMDSPLKIQKVVSFLQEKIDIINPKYLLIDYWDNNEIWDSEIPYKWLFNGTYDIFKGRFMQISPSKPMEYVRTGKYEYFRIITKERGIQYGTLDGDILMPMEYFQQTSVNESVEKDDLNIDNIIYSDNFKRWFGNWQNNPQNSSKVVDENGLPLIVHHGSPKFIGDKFNKSYIGKSMNSGEKGIFCTTQDMNWAKRFSYPATKGSTSFSVKLDMNKPGDILSGFLNMRHPLDFFNLTDEDYNNMWQMVVTSKKEQGFNDFGTEKDRQKWFNECQELLKIGNHQLIKFALCSGWMNFGDILKQYGYDGYIAKMKPNDSAVEYCFIEPNQFKSIKSFGFNPESESIYENKRHLIESWQDLEDIYEEYSVTDLLSEFTYDKNNGISQKKWDLIPAQQYHTLLKRYMSSPEMARIPYNIVYNWFINIIVPNALDIENITNLAGHSSYFPSEDVSDYFDVDINDYEDGSEYLESIGFYDWCKLPDGTDAWSDYGLQPLFKIINEYTPNASAEEILILINRCLDVVHWRGDLSSAFIQGGKKSCNYISNNIKESIENIDRNSWFLIRYAINTYGITDDFDSTGFILLNGELLDFGNYDEIYRQSHGALDLKGKNFRDFINIGNIRVNPQSPGIEFCKEPREEQYNRISEMIQYYDNSEMFYVDCVDSNATNIWNKAYTKQERQNIINDIKRYFREGKTPCDKGNDVLCGFNIRDFLGENVENELSSSEVDLSSFNIKKNLNPDFWKDGHLDSRIRMKLLDIADDFIETLNIDSVKPVDIIMTGSLANFNWNKKYSDIDLHVVYDYNDIDDNKEFIKEYFDSKKQLWNQKHKDLTIYGFNVELYVQDANEEHASSGVYSIEKDKWLVEPDREVLATSKVNKEYIKDKASYYSTKIDELCYQFKKAKNDEYKIRKISEKAEKLFDEIKKMRKTGFEKSGGKEINSLNIVFKFLRRYGYLEKLSNLKVKSYDKMQGI